MHLLDEIGKAQYPRNNSERESKPEGASKENSIRTITSHHTGLIRDNEGRAVEARNERDDSTGVRDHHPETVLNSIARLIPRELI